MHSEDEKLSIAELRKGDPLTYRKESATYTGIVLERLAPRRGEACYTVQRDGASQQEASDIIVASEIVRGLFEPHMQQCPYCRQMHYIGTIESCPRKPRYDVNY